MEDHIFELYRRFRDQSRDEEKITTPQVSTTKTYSQNLFITICKSKKVKLMSISCEEIPETDSGLGQIFSPQNIKQTQKYCLHYLLIMDLYLLLKYVFNL